MSKKGRFVMMVRKPVQVQVQVQDDEKDEE
jgi:hypothetical protein